jgi:hypothetical protein
LLERGKVDPGGVDEARRTQSFFGGDLASHLVQLGHVAEADLGEALEAVTGAEWADPHLRDADANVATRVSSGIAARHRVCPFQLDGRTLRLAMLNPKDAIAIAAVREETGLEPEAWVASEHRLLQALRRFHRIDVDRIEGLRVHGTRRADRHATAITRPGSAPETPADSPTVDVGLDGLPLDAEVSIEDHPVLGATRSPVAPRADSREADTVPDRRPRRDRPEPVSSTTAPAVSGVDALSTLEARLAIAHDRDEIALALLDFCRLRAARCALFAVSSEGLRCLAGRGRSLNTERLRRIHLPTDGGTVFATALETEGFYLGPVPPLPANKDVFSLLGGRLPPSVLIIPIRLRGRVVALLYLDNDVSPLTTPDIPLMRRVALKAGIAFELLLLRGKLLRL